MDTVKNSDEKLVLVNIVEESVRIEVKKLLKALKLCCCDRCYLDACAISLNSLKPYYVTTTKGAVMKKLENYNIENQTSVIVEATKAVLIVKDSPWHKHEFKMSKY